MDFKRLGSVAIAWGLLVALLLALLVALPAKAPAEKDINPSPLPSPATAPSAVEIGINDLLVVISPEPMALVKSPLTVKGRARGTWFFEASAPVRILDANGKELGVVPAQAEGEWMTTDFVNFSAALDFKTPTTATGTLVFQNDNPSGLPQNYKKFEMVVRFK